MLLRYFWPASLWTIIILVLTLMPGKAIPDVGFFNADKLVHFFVFGLLMVLTSYAIAKMKVVRGTPDNPMMISFIYSVALGIAIEVLQQFVPGRSFSVADMIANTIGVTLGYFAFIKLQRRIV
jgi:VanZ family protein